MDKNKVVGSDHVNNDFGPCIADFSIILCVILFFLAIGACCYMYVKSDNAPVSNMQTIDNVTHLSVSIDTLNVANRHKLDDLMTVVMKNDSILKHIHNDFRGQLGQETNNIINRMNAWFSFWIGILALIGVGLPIALQFKLQRADRRKLEEFKAEFEKERKSLVDKKNEMERLVRQQRISFFKYTKGFDAVIHKNEYHSLVNALNMGLDDDAFVEVDNRTDIIKGLLENALMTFHKELEIISQDKLKVRTDDGVWLTIQESLVMLHSILIRLETGGTLSLRNLRNMNVMRDQIVGLIGRSKVDATTNFSQYCNDLFKIIDELKYIVSRLD